MFNFLMVSRWTFNLNSLNLSITKMIMKRFFEKLFQLFNVYLNWSWLHISAWSQHWQRSPFEVSFFIPCDVDEMNFISWHVLLWFMWIENNWFFQVGGVHLCGISIQFHSSGWFHHRCWGNCSWFHRNYECQIFSCQTLLKSRRNRKTKIIENLGENCWIVQF